MWFSSGGTKSVLHTDSVDNLNCLFSGSKELYMVDKVSCSSDQVISFPRICSDAKYESDSSNE